MRRASIRVYGMVQGVGFRYAAKAAAIARRINGHVKNLDDGSVEIECEGQGEQIDEFVEAIRSFKEPIVVQDVEVSHADGTGELKSFRIVSGDLADEMVEGFGTGLAFLQRLDSKQDKMLDKQDQTITAIRTFSSSMLDKQDKMLDKQDKMLDKQDQTITAIRTFSSSMLDKQDKMLDKQDKMLDKQDQMLDKQDQMLDKQDKMLDKQDQTITAIRTLSSSMHDMMDSRFQKIEREISEIRTKMNI